MKSILVLFFIVAFGSGCVVETVVRRDVYVPAPVEVEMVPEIIYEERVYYTPPILVTYPYDYFYYIRDGMYVNIVFVDRLGHRRIEHWNHGGARMTHTRISDWHRNYRVPRSALVQHQQRTRPAERAITPHRPGAAHAAPPPAVQRPDTKTHTAPPAVQHPNPTAPHSQPPAPTLHPPSARPPQTPAIKQPPTRQSPAPVMRQPAQPSRVPAKKAAPPGGQKKEKQ